MPQLKYLDKDEFKDVPRLTKIRLDGNQLSVVIDHLFEAQKGLQFLGIFNFFPFSPFYICIYVCVIFEGVKYKNNKILDNGNSHRSTMYSPSCVYEAFYVYNVHINLSHGMENKRKITDKCYHDYYQHHHQHRHCAVEKQKQRH